jgi:hypothetical protein
MEYTDRPSKRVTFEEPIFIDIVDRFDEKEVEFKRKRPRTHFKFILWALAAAFLVFLLGGSHGQLFSNLFASVKRICSLALGLDSSKVSGAF